MTLRERQSIFVWMVTDLIRYGHSLGYEFSFGDAWAKSGHREGSYHYKRLAIDLNLFIDGKYMITTKDHEKLGEYWESIGGTWGGHFKKQDGNHYSFGEGTV